MTTEALLKPRYKVIADYPGNSNIVGDMINIQNAGTPEAAKLVCWWYDKFPHLFQKLEWWEDRKPEDMPEYLVWVDNKSFCKPQRYNGSYFYLSDDDSFGYHLGYTMPATETEYNEYIKIVSK